VENFELNVEKASVKASYSQAYKAVVAEYCGIGERGEQGKRGNGSWSIVEKYNRQYMWSKNDRKLTRQAIQMAVHGQGDIGVASPPKRGPRCKRDPEVTL
jgi:hypothetical protein